MILGVLALLGASQFAGQLPAFPGPPGGTIRLERFHSPALASDKAYVIYLPPSYQTDSLRRHPVLYLLHGRTGNEADWIVRGEIDVVADSAFRHGVPEMILVMPDGDNSFWVNWSVSPPDLECGGNTSLGEAAEVACVPNARYADYVAHDLVAHIEGSYRTIPDRLQRGVAGLSMGGTGAVTLALTYPGVFTAAAALSPVAIPMYLEADSTGRAARVAMSFEELEASLGRPLANWRMRWGADSTHWWQHDPARAARHRRDEGGPLPCLWLEVGRDDQLAEENLMLDSTLSALGIVHRFLLRDGDHSSSYWRKHIGETLGWIGRTFSDHASSRRPDGCPVHR